MQVNTCFGAGVVFGGGPAPQIGLQRFPVAQVPLLFPHLRQESVVPAPRIGCTCAACSLLFEIAEIATFTPQEKIKFENDMRTERDLRNQMAYAEEKGMEKGMEIARAQIVAKLRKLGYSEEEIVRIVNDRQE